MVSNYCVTYFTHFCILEHSASACLHTFYTWDEHKYHILEDLGVTLIGQDFFRFEVMACNDVYLLLMKNRADVAYPAAYEIGLGKEGFFNVVTSMLNNAHQRVSTEISSIFLRLRPL